MERIEELEAENKALRMKVSDLKVKVSKKDRDLSRLMEIVAKAKPSKEK